MCILSILLSLESGCYTLPLGGRALPPGLEDVTAGPGDSTTA
jgi:hypothetical protein